MKISFKVWLEEEDHRVRFGEGRSQLLQAIADHGSLAQAAKKMNMSYRAAWGRLKASEDRLGYSFGGKRYHLRETRRIAFNDGRQRRYWKNSMRSIKPWPNG